MNRETIKIGDRTWNVAKTKEQAIEDYKSQGRIYIANGSMSQADIDDVVDSIWNKKQSIMERATQFVNDITETQLKLNKYKDAR